MTAIRHSVDHMQTIESTVTDKLQIPRAQLSRLGASTLCTLPTMIDLIRLGVADTIRLHMASQHVVLSSDTDKVVPVAQLLYRHVPPNGKQYALPADITADMIAHMPNVTLSESRREVSIAKTTARIKKIGEGKFRFLAAYEELDLQALLCLFKSHNARVCYGDVAEVQVFPE
jgi:hypothetical protein